MSGNLGGAYESFLSRCIGGIHKEQEAFRELAEVTKHLEYLAKMGNALGLNERCEFEGAGELMESYQKGKTAFDMEGNVYSILLPLKNLAKKREEVLKVQKAALFAKIEDVENALQEAAKEAREAEEKDKQAKESNETRGVGVLVGGIFCYLILMSAYYSPKGKMPPAWLISIPFVMVILYFINQKRRERHLEKTGGRLNTSMQKLAMLNQRKEELEKAKTRLEAAEEGGNQRQKGA